MLVPNSRRVRALSPREPPNAVLIGQLLRDPRTRSDGGDRAPSIFE
jgi:hypothetical protein